MAALAVHGHKTEDKAIAAGVVCVEPGGSVLLLRRRTDAEDHPGEWAFPAGGVENGESPEQAAARELKEETGHDAEGLEPFGTYTEPGIHFTCFWMVTTRKFEPMLCREHSAYVWARPGNLPSPLHPGVAKLLLGQSTRDASFDESKHPRATNGEFSQGGAQHSPAVKQAVSWYQHHGFGSINRGLRTGKVSKNGAEAIKQIDSAFTPSTKEQVLHRGAGWVEGHPALGVRKGDPQVGVVFSDPAYTSTSVDEVTARQFTRATAFKIHVPAGTPTLDIAAAMHDDKATARDISSKEGEVLLPRGTKFKITGFERDKSGLLKTVHVSVVGSTTTHDDAEAGKDDKLGHWLTLNGAHVFVNGEGTIIKGPAHLMGKNKNDSVDTTQAKPVAPAKGVKAIVHQLLTTGHPFSFDELKSATGAKLNQQLHNAINELKAGKGALGSLMIQKVGGHYQVVKPDGTPAAALETVAPGETKANEVDPFENFTLEPIPETPKEDLLVKKPTVAEMDPMTVTPEEWNKAIAEEKAGAQEETQPPTPAAPIAPSPPPAPPSASIWTAKPPATLMSKADADAAYAKELQDANEQAAADASMATDPDFDDPVGFLEATAKSWKQAKAMAMAQWAANFKGGPHTAKPVEVFPADIKLVQALGKAEGDAEAQAKAVSDWKSATAQAKANAKAPPVTESKAAAQGLAPKADTTPTGGHTLSAPEVIVPADHKHITKDDFAGEEGYVNQISKAHKALHGSASANASTNKAHVQQQLEKRLSASPHFAEMEKQFKANGGVSLASSMIQAWAGSSGDHQPKSVAAQLAIRDVFNMHPDEVETKAFHLLSTSKNSEEDVYKQAAQAYGIDVKTPAKLESFKAGLRDFALAQYHETQDHLAKLGIKEMFLIRGMKFGEGGAGPQEVNVKLQPASSFTTAHATARSFAGGHSLFAVKVPASQILSSFVTGFGCTGESEVVVLNHSSLQAIQIGSLNAPSATAMSAHINKYLGGATATKKTTTTPKKPGGKFKPTNLPEKTTGMSSKWYTKLTTAAKAGDLDQLEAYGQEIGQLKLPNTKKHWGMLMSHVQAQHAEYKAKQVNQASHAQPGAPVKKNAYYYKKLKDKIMSHPEHTEANYKMGKSQGMTNEEILAQYEKVHAQNTKEY